MGERVAVTVVLGVQCPRGEHTWIVGVLRQRADLQTLESLDVGIIESGTEDHVRHESEARIQSVDMRIQTHGTRGPAGVDAQGERESLHFSGEGGGIPVSCTVLEGVVCEVRSAMLPRGIASGAARDDQSQADQREPRSLDNPDPQAVAEHELDWGGGLEVGSRGDRRWGGEVDHRGLRSVGTGESKPDEVHSAPPSSGRTRRIDRRSAVSVEAAF